MPVGLGLASSHAPSMFAPLEKWKPIYKSLSGGVPAPPELAGETEDVLKDYIQRIRHGFGTLGKQLQAYKPDALIIVGDDQNEVFGPAFNASLAIYLGEE